MRIRDLLDNVNDLTTDDVLNVLGLQRRSGQVLPMIGLFGIGVLVGTGVGLLVAPKSGRDIRRDIRDKMNDVRERGMEAAREARQRAESRFSDDGGSGTRTT